MTRQLFKIFFTFFCFQSSIITTAQKIESIIINENNEFDDEQYIAWSEVNPGDEYSAADIEEIKRKIYLGLSSHGYYNPNLIISTSAEDSASINLILTVNENEPTYINRIIFNEVDSLNIQPVEEGFKFLEGNIFIKSDLERSISESLDYFENNGYPFASIKIESLNFYRDSLKDDFLVDIYLYFRMSETSKIDQIKITGNTKTKDYVIKRNIRLEEGETYSQERIEEIPKLLNRLRFFEPVKQPVYYFNSEDKGILEITVKEKETNTFDGILGYIPSTTGGESGFFTGFVNISLRNIFGTERAAAFRWEKLERESQELELKYLEPWLLGYPVNVQASLFQRKQDSTYVQRRIDGDIQFLITEDFSASFLIGTESTIPTDPDTRGFTVFNSTSIITGANLKIDSRNDVYSPTEGLLFINTYKFSQKKINGPSQFITGQTKTKIELQRFELDLSAYYEIFARQVVAAGVHAREMRGDDFEISDLYKLGGTNTLRGYRENQFLGNRTFWSNLEYRYLLTQRSFAFIFFDTGYYLRNGSPARNLERISSFNYGYGLGLSLETGLGVLGVSFALGEGDSFADGKIHFGILNEF